MKLEIKKVREIINETLKDWGMLQLGSGYNEKYVSVKSLKKELSLMKKDYEAGIEFEDLYEELLEKFK